MELKDNNSKAQQITENIINSELAKGTLFIKEKYLDCLPTEWLECLMFIKYNGMRDEGHPVIILNDQQTEEMLNFLQKDDVKLIVFPEDRICWEVLLIKTYNKNTDLIERIFVGGEKMRKFCDDKNIFYRSHLNDDNKLLSGTDMRWLKKENEDCRIPQTEEDIKNGGRITQSIQCTDRKRIVEIS